MNPFLHTDMLDAMEATLERVTARCQDSEVAPLYDRAEARAAEADAENDARVSDVLNAAEEMLAVLREIVHAYTDTYDAEGDVNGHWIGAASIPVATMERACALLTRLR